MAILTDNAQRFYFILASKLNHIATIHFPHEWRTFGWRHAGSLVTVNFLHTGLNNKEGLVACIETILRMARKEAVLLVKGVRSEFSTCCVSASSSVAQDLDPFLRFSIGIEAEEVDDLARIAVDGN